MKDLEKRIEALESELKELTKTVELFTNELVDTIAKSNALLDILVSQSFATEEQVEANIEEQKIALLSELLD